MVLLCEVVTPSGVIAAYVINMRLISLKRHNAENVARRTPQQFFAKNYSLTTEAE